MKDPLLIFRVFRCCGRGSGRNARPLYSVFLRSLCFHSLICSCFHVAGVRVKVRALAFYSELAKYDTWEELPKGLINLLDPKSDYRNSKQNAFENMKTRGVGQTTLLKFMGN